MRVRRGGGWTDNLSKMLYPGGPDHQMYSGPGKDCAVVDVPRPGMITGYVPKGIPGLSLTGGGGQLGSGGPYVPVMKGGRYGNFPQLGPLSPMNAVGMSGYAPIGRVGCEMGTTNTLNPNLAAQETNTAVSSVGIKGWTQMFKGGSKSRRQRRQRRQQRGGVVVGQADSMRYYAPTAGYDNRPMTPQVQNNPGVLMQVGYPAREFNQACVKTA
jgi:hypothetical protein